jgi:hypothetical protein
VVRPPTFDGFGSTLRITISGPTVSGVGTSVGVRVGVAEGTVVGLLVGVDVVVPVRTMVGSGELVGPKRSVVSVGGNRDAAVVAGAVALSLFGVAGPPGVQMQASKPTIAHTNIAAIRDGLPFISAAHHSAFASSKPR